MAAIRPEEISSVIQKEIQAYQSDLKMESVGTVLQVGDGIARVYGLEAAMAGELSAPELSAPEARVSPVIAGRFGLLPAAVATPLALVLTELLQNALQHGLAHPPGAAPAGTLKVTVDRAPAGLTVTVEDSGVGLPEGFRLDAATSLGLQIVRTLVVSELGGRLEISPRAGGGTAVLVALPLETSAVPQADGQASGGPA